MPNMNAREFGAQNRCTKRRTLNGVNMKDAASPTMNQSVAVRTCIKEYLKGTLSLNDAPDMLKKMFHDVGYVNLYQEEANLKEMTFRMMRFLNTMDALRGTFRLLTPQTRTINVFGQAVDVTPDIVMCSANKVQAFVIKTSAPKKSMAGKTNDSVNNDLMCYCLWKYAADIATPSDVCEGGYLYLGKPNSHENDTAFGVLDAGNTTAFRALSFAATAESIVDNLFAPVYAEFQIGAKCDDAACMFCPFTNACHFNVPPLVNKQKVQKKMGDVTLSPAQEQAVNFMQGIGRIKAGAGAGKTLVVTLRVMTLLLAGYDPEKMLLITFTINGAAEMRQRIQFYCDEYGFGAETADKIKICTFNSFGQIAIENEYASLGYTEPPQVVDSIIRKKIILDTIAGTQLDGINYKSFEAMYGNGGFDKVCAAFDYFKMWGLNSFNWESPDEEIHTIVRNAPVPINDAWMRVYDEYNATLKSRNLIEYADQQRLLEAILADNPYYIEEKYGFQHVIVDEFQDTSDVEIRMLKKLVDSKDFVSLLVVGDDSQNIFETMRGTNNDNIIHFDEKMGEEIVDFQLMDNYRSTPEIIDIANKINSRRKSKLDGDLMSKRNHGAPIDVYAFKSRKGEYAWVADTIANQVNNGIAPETIAFIARDGNELKDMGTELAARGIPSQLLTPEKVNMNSRVIAAISLAEFLDNTDTTQCAFDYLNTVQNGVLFEKTAQEINDEVASFKQTIEEAKGEKNNIDLFFEYLEKLDASDETYKQFADKLGKFTSFGDVLTYARAMKRFGQKETYRRQAYAGKGVVLTTVHSSKGLEWDHVYVSVTKFNDKTKEEESRRVLFTAVTRARDELVCTGVANKQGSVYLSEIANHLGKHLDVVLDEEDTEELIRKERAEEFKRIRKEAQPIIP